MSLNEPQDVEREKIDSGVHIRDTERSAASMWQVFVAGLLVVAIVTVFFYGLTSQRVEVAGAPPPQSNIASPLGADQQKANAPQQAKTNVPAPAVNQAPPPMTTGSAPKR